ncbi:bifunctional folylpolyglutamate synthase/dihydrofolate synthase [Heyndrickxia ginsengihumi]|uniref:Dihydrofolate synthase/folylpolyglutamate synthase n=1 Tax=Heyndrickxia ginsengihumi TaxID=363870 RepID=A0A0A6VH37_9BACI|nr:folylpolyglutamate synthase/dihydrofolate synthase family protein [Heyndrickxia ginsengihumi]KHD86891.1 folylpolyglutamate synthase [Heyndrickxia ginsengihumi]MBE6183846.1 bifunctional folylpolyglutamate synthase/dihydrofolate synthase [Bacillus sp. (in: firmicutes)]MCM3021902.1 bifunctional folylpolyglutamate synthase/dihydrofolate synthase [Heyndrickxia ginsengihumi]NEY20412.1 bifunctional folylpolyglutamate synthase/dihydrofolate synthase [Heyndrickxia ginsengihumi]
MIETYEEAIAWVQGRLKLGIKPGLERMQWLMEKWNHPEDNIKTIHIAGTNGKGSTVCYLRNILQQAKYEVGTFTSPYLEQFNERISINGVPIQDHELVLLVNAIKPLAEELEETDLGSPTEFEVITAMAIYYFAAIHPVDIVLFEVGLGGRLDSTNVISPLMSIITNIGHDHMNILGNSLAEIAYEKAGIIKHKVPVITAVEQQEALHVIEQKASEQRSSLYRANQEFTVVHKQSTGNGEMFSLISPLINEENMQISMKGHHQVYNASLAVIAVTLLNQLDDFHIDQHAIQTGLINSRWSGRFEQLSKHPLIIIDGAHNPEGIKSLVETIQTHLKDKNIRIVFSALGDKSLHEMIPQLDDVADSILFTTFDFPRAIPAKALFDISHHEHKTYIEDWRAGIQQIVKELQETDALVITGSLYFIAEVRKYLLEQ